MRINVIEKFGLYERLSDLAKGLNEHEESQNICNKAIHDLKSGFTSSKFNLYLEQLKQYEWITGVQVGSCIWPECFVPLQTSRGLAGSVQKD